VRETASGLSAFSFNAQCADCRRNTVRIDATTLTQGDTGMTKTPAIRCLLAGYRLMQLYHSYGKQKA
jgi:hypothetical protein